MLAIEEIRALSKVNPEFEPVSLLLLPVVSYKEVLVLILVHIIRIINN